MPRAAVDRVVGEDERDRAELAHAPARLPHRELHVVERQDRRGPQARAIGRAKVGQPAVERAADRGREVGLEAVDGDEMRAERAEDDRDVDALPVHRLQHGPRIVAAQVIGRISIAARRHVAGARFFASDPGEAAALRSVEERGEDLALELPAVGVRAVDRREPRRAVLEPRLDVPEPQIVRLEHVNVAVHDLEAVLGHRGALRPSLGDRTLVRRPRVVKWRRSATGGRR